jgi:hypothetical protein
MEHEMRKIKPAVLALLAIFLFIPGSLLAQTGFGLRAGVTADPNQFHFGAHFASDPFIDHLTFRPNLEIGIGSDVTTLAANFEFAYKIPIPRHPVSAYIGAGPAFDLYKYSGKRTDSETGGGFNILIGLEHQRGFFGEAKVGALDSPDFKFTIGYTFK